MFIYIIDNETAKIRYGKYHFMGPLIPTVRDYFYHFSVKIISENILAKTSPHVNNIIQMNSVAGNK